jgi:beta-lactamase superfamily II metal-dependent hydrolase
VRAMDHCFVGLPKTPTGKSVQTFLFKENRKTKVRQVLWGDWLTVDGEEPDGWMRIRWAPNSENPEMLFIPKDHTTDTRPLEIVFLDVGQGDGAVLITPERDDGERVIVIDAGDSGNMHAFLSKRFRPYNETSRFHAAVITHPDQDHYGGFDSIFGAPVFGFDVVYHNGLVERPVSGTFEKLGAQTHDPASGRDYLQDLAVDKASIERLFGAGVDIGKFAFPRVMRNALNNPNIVSFSMLSNEHGTKEDERTWVPGFAPSDGRPYLIEVVAPVVEFDAAGAPRLRKIGSYGETKNGHSVILRLHFGHFKVLFGGDLNDKAEKFLLTHYSGMTRFPNAGSAAYNEMIEQAANWFRADIMKVCHHGSEKVTDAFLQTAFPAAFVISSGDEEGHVHPRPDLLGRLGKLGRSDAPVILSTELQRSTRDLEDEKLVLSLAQRVLNIAENASEDARRKIVEDIFTLGRSNVTVYGTIYLKTDGQRLIAAFRIETGSETKKWFTFEYAMDADGNLHLVS